MNIWMDGLAVLVDQARAVFSILITIIWGQILIITLLKKIFKNHFTSAEYFSLGMAGWILPAALWAALLFLGVTLFGETAASVVSALAAAAFLYALFAGKSERHSFLPGSTLILVLVASVVLRLAFLRKAILPMYFDSAEHYRIIKYFANYYVSPGGSFPLTSYYHVGYHFLSAALSHYFSLGIVDTMLVFGQIMLAVLPLSLFFIIRRETRSNAAAVFASLLAGFGWHMPAYAVNWGKYPALLGLIGIHFVLSVGYVAYRNKFQPYGRERKNKFKSKRSILYWLLGFGVLVSTLVHTRSLIIYAFMAMSLLLTMWRGRLPLIFQRLSAVFVLFTLIVQIITVQRSTVLAPLFGVYMGRDLWLTTLVIFLSIFSAQAFTDLTFFLLVILSLMLAGLFIPVTGLSGYGTLSLLDRPYVQMLFYLPLSILGGLGLAGLGQFLQKFFFWKKRLVWPVILALFAAVFFNAGANHDFYPSDCCQIVSRDDLAVLEWMDKKISQNADILTASTNMSVTSFERPEARAGVDGGVWVTPLISRKTTFMNGELNFDQPESRARICRRSIDYVYVGGMPQSFDALQLNRRPDWYQVVFSLPDAKVYKVIGCE